MIKRGEDFAELHGPLGGLAAETIRRANHLAGLHAASEEQPARDARPMIASAVLVDGGRAAELAPNDHRNILVQSALVQILDQRAESLIEQRQVLAQSTEVVAVMVPAAERQGDAAGARFDQPARNEKMLHQFRTAIVAVLGIACAVTFHDTLVFLLQIEGLKEFAGGEHAEGSFVERIESFHQAACIHVPAKIIEPGQKPLAVRR